MGAEERQENGVKGAGRGGVSNAGLGTVEKDSSAGSSARRVEAQMERAKQSSLWGDITVGSTKLSSPFCWG